MNLLIDFIEHFKLYYGVELKFIQHYDETNMFHFKVRTEAIPELEIFEKQVCISHDQFLGLWYTPDCTDKILLTKDVHESIITKLKLFTVRYHKYCMSTVLTIPELLKVHPYGTTVHFTISDTDTITLCYESGQHRIEYIVAIESCMIEDFKDWWNMFHKGRESKPVTFLFNIALQKRIACILQDLHSLLK